MGERVVRKLAVFAFSFSAAVLGANYLLPSQLWAAGAALCGVLFLLALFIFKGKRRLAAGLVCAGLALGLGWTQVYDHLFFDPARELDDQTVRLTATVRDYPQESDYGYKVSVVMKTEIGGKLNVLLYTDGQGANLRPGDQITTVTHLTLATKSSAGEDITYYTAKGIFLWGVCYGRVGVNRPERIPVRYWPAQLAHDLKASIDACFPESSAALVRAVVTGSREKLTDQFTSSLERTGLSHTVAVSGMHLSCFAGILALLLGRGRRSTAAIVIAWALLFCGVAGSTPSVSRAAVMLILLEIAPLLYRQRDDVTALAFALMLLLAWNPYSAAHVGLQLSFAAVAGIFLFSQRMQTSLLEKLQLTKRQKTAPRRLGVGAVRAVLSVLCATLGAMLATIPLTAVHFGTCSLIAPVSNLLTIWAVSGVFAGGLLSGVVGIVAPALGQILAVPVSWLAGYLDWSTNLLSGFTFSALSLDSVYYRAWLVFCYLALFAAFAVKGKRRYIVPACCVVVTLAASITLTAMGMDRGGVSLTALDVGQGQSVLVRCGGRLALIDCGGDAPDNPGDTAADYLQAQGYGKLDFLILSHFHDDHANGIPQLLRRIEVGELFVPDVEPDSPLRQEILALAAEENVPVRFVCGDTAISMEQGARIEVFAPLSRSGDTNELGLTVLVRDGAFDALIPGDMSGTTERVLLRHTDLPDLEVLVAAHHGAASSTTRELLEQTTPEVCVISVGAHNRYGHPAQETLERLALAGAELYRTDLHGTVAVASNLD